MDKNGNLYYKTRKEAEKRMKTLKSKGEYSGYRVSDFELKGTTYYRVEMRGASDTEDKTVWKEGLIYETRADADYQGRKRIKDGRAIDYRIKEVPYQGQKAYQIFLKKGDMKLVVRPDTKKPEKQEEKLSGQVYLTFDDGP